MINEKHLQRFENIRPFTDKEVKENISYLLQIPEFVKALAFIFDDNINEITGELKNINTVADFQKNIVYKALERIIENSIDKLSFKNINQLSNNDNYIFISNHRDIVLDSALINFGLVKHKLDTAEIAIGNNLLNLDWVKRLVRLNKNFIVRRNLERHELYQASLTLSEYIHFAKNQKKQSIWIAQREGRAKDGNDFTQPSLIKMLLLNAPKNDIKSYVQSLNILPVSISYEFDPTDLMKLNELTIKQNNQTYTKAPMEDEQHMVAGMLGYKGNVTISFTQPLNDYMNDIDFNKPLNHIVNQITKIIDKLIVGNYQLHNSNEIAYQLMNETIKPEEIKDYSEFHNRLKQLENVPQQQKELFLKMYANPVINKVKT